MKTFIRWQGNKSKHLNKFMKYIPEFTGTYIEPFVGSGALFLELQPKKWIINDLNKDLIYIWKHVKYTPKEMIHAFKEFAKTFIPLSNSDKKKYCKLITSKINSMEFGIERASIYLLMKYCSFMGDIIKNNKFYFGSLNMHIFMHNNYFFTKQPCYDNLLQVSQFLQNTRGKIYNMSYEHILDKAKKGDFVFLDPPYIEEHDYQFNYNPDEVLDTQFIQTLYKQVKQFDKKGKVTVITSLFNFIYS
jgi:DNA adenine methylase